MAYFRRKGEREPDFGRPTGLGTRVHNALEYLYSNDSPSAAEIVAFVQHEIEHDLEEFPSFEPEIKKDGDLALRMMEGYLQWLEEEGLDQYFKVVSTEDKKEVPFLPHKGVTILSKLDARLMDVRDSSRWALEHKTVQTLKQAMPTLQIDTQLLTEHLVEFIDLMERGEDAEAERADGVLYNMLRKVKRTAAAKPPFYGRVPVRHNVEELRNHWRHVAVVANEILEAHERLGGGECHHDVVPPSPTRDCNWDCPFFQLCPLMDDGSDWEAALSDLYVDVDPLARYSEDNEVKES